jgi:hypothetical protein
MPTQENPPTPVVAEVTRFILWSKTLIVQPSRPASPGSCTPSPSESLNLKTQISPKQGGVGVRVGVEEGGSVGVTVRVLVRVRVNVIVGVMVGVAVIVRV